MLKTSLPQQDRPGEQEAAQGLEAAVTEALSEVRRELSRETGYAAYLVFPNATLGALAVRRPQTMAALGGIAGLGPKRIQAYGERIGWRWSLFSLAWRGKRQSPFKLQIGHSKLTKQLRLRQSK
ncbi:HRDC domain-containing protein [Deinococcus hopiensis]|uniref:HRDC domain-containing protein n=1 Tax=Deinococcus hopiensis TaxID=309885 RepID=UPI001FED19A3|nr:HRDC domain-containing protein [Deinococcus hopiensis]